MNQLTRPVVSGYIRLVSGVTPCGHHQSRPRAGVRDRASYEYTIIFHAAAQIAPTTHAVYGVSRAVGVSGFSEPAPPAVRGQSLKVRSHEEDCGHAAQYYRSPGEFCVRTQV